MGGVWVDVQCGWRRAVVLLAVGAALAGCSSTPSGGESSSILPSLTGSFPGWFAASPQQQQQQTPVGAPPLPSVVDDCPIVEIRPGASTLPVSAKTEQATLQDLRYQLTFTETARQCSIVGRTMRMRVGVQGRAWGWDRVGHGGQHTRPVRESRDVSRTRIQPSRITPRDRSCAA